MENGFDSWDKGTADYSSVIAYCPYCGEMNELPIMYASSNTTGIVHCEKCGRELNI